MGNLDMSSNFRIELLADHLEAVPVLKEWFEKDWAPYYGPDGPGDAEKDLMDSCNHAKLPIALVAFEDGEVCGTAALKWESVMTHAQLSPWLAALLVGDSFRRQGIAERLIEAVEEMARRLGFACIYVGTGEGSGTPETSLRKRGWEYIDKGPYFVSEASIFKKIL